MFVKGSKSDSILIGFSILGILVLSYLLYDDSLFFKDGGSGKSKVIGKIYTNSSDVRRKYIDNFAWLPIQDLSNVFLGDSVFTGAKSKATIKLNTGANVNIEPQSLIVLSMNEDNLTLDLQFGSLDAELLTEKSNLNLKMGNEELSLKGSSGPSTLSFQKENADQAPELKVKKGKLNVRQGKNKKLVEVKESYKLVLDADRTNLKVKSIIGFKEDSILQSKVYVQNGEPIQFAWKHDGEVVAYELEVAEDVQFKKNIFKTEIQGEKFDWQVPENTNKIFWRVRAYNPRDRQISISETHEMLIQKLSAPKILTPSMSQVFTALRDNNDKVTAPPVVGLSIEDSSDASRYIIELSLDEQFQKIAHQVESKTKNTELKSLAFGHYFIRVKSVSAGRADSPWSHAVSFSVEQQGSQLIAAPILPKKDFEHQLKQRQGKFVWPTLVWQEVVKVDKYVVELSTDFTFKSNEFINTVEKTSVEVPNLKMGKYFYRVRAVRANIFGAWSDVGSVSVVQPAPGVSPIDDIILTEKSWQSPVPPQVLRIKWDTFVGASNYFLEVATGEDFKNIYSSKTTDKTSFVVTLTKDQSYFVRVTPLNSNLKQLTSSSDVEKFDFIIRRPLKPPVLRQPKNKMSYILYKMDVPHIWIEWEGDEKATLYVIEFSKDAEFTKIKKTMEMKKNNMVLDKNLLKGKIYWRVRSVNEKTNMKSEWSTPQIFFVVGLENEED